MSVIIHEADLPQELTAEQAVEAAYANELAEVASKLTRTLPCLIECDKDLGPFLYLNVRNRARGRGEFTTAATAPWSLGRLAQPIGLIALVWVLLISVLFSLPPNELVLWTLLLVALTLAAYWLLLSRHRFRGPAVSGEGGGR